MTLEEKLSEVREKYPEVYEAICVDAPELVGNPSEASAEDLDHYNFWIDAILDEDDAQHLYHLVN